MRTFKIIEEVAAVSLMRNTYTIKSDSAVIPDVEVLKLKFSLFECSTVKPLLI